MVLLCNSESPFKIGSDKIKSLFITKLVKKVATGITPKKLNQANKNEPFEKRWKGGLWKKYLVNY